MYLKVVCAWCGKFMGIKECEGSNEGHMLISHSMCPDCRRKLNKFSGRIPTVQTATKTKGEKS